MSGSRCRAGFAKAAAGGCKAALTTRPPLVHYCVRSPPPGRRNVEELEKKITAFVLLSLHIYFAKPCIVVEIVPDVLFMCVAGERCRSFIDLAPPSEKGECGTPGPPELPNIEAGLRYFHSSTVII